jgi:hypothetical protein
MSEGGIHVHGAHEHALEHQAHGGDSLSLQVALFTAVLAAFGAVVGYLGGHTQNQAMLYKNEAVLLKAHASDQWAFYQAKSTKGHLMEMAGRLVAEDKQAFYLKEAARYDAEKKDIKLKAEEFDRKSADADAESEHELIPHTRLAVAMTAIQIAIALASVTALTRQRWLLVPAILATAASVGFTTWAYL